MGLWEIWNCNIVVNKQNVYERGFKRTLGRIQEYKDYSSAMVSSMAHYFKSEFFLSFYRNEEIAKSKEWLSHWGSCLFLYGNTSCMYSSVLTPLIGVIASDNPYLLSKFKSLEAPKRDRCRRDGNLAAGFIPVLWYLLKGDKPKAYDELEYWRKEVGFNEHNDDPGLEMIRYEFAASLIDDDVDRIKLCMSRMINKDRLKKYTISNEGEQYISSEAILLPKIVKLLGYDIDFENELIFDALIDLNPLPVYKTLDSYIGQFVDKKTQKLFEI